jgi:hypothetical protein
VYANGESNKAIPGPHPFPQPLALAMFNTELYVQTSWGHWKLENSLSECVIVKEKRGSHAGVDHFSLCHVTRYQSIATAVSSNQKDNDRE